MGYLPALERNFNIEGSQDGAYSSDQPRGDVPQYHRGDLCAIPQIILESQNIPVWTPRTSSSSVETVISPHLEEKRLNRF